MPDIPADNFYNGSFSIIFLILFFIVLLLVWRQLRRPKNKARRRLNRLQKQVDQSSETTKTSVFEIADIIKDGFELSCLTVGHVISNQKQKEKQIQKHDWFVFVQKLDSARYSSELISKTQLTQLMLEARHWLR